MNFVNINKFNLINNLKPYFVKTEQLNQLKDIKTLILI